MRPDIDCHRGLSLRPEMRVIGVFADWRAIPWSIAPVVCSGFCTALNSECSPARSCLHRLTQRSSSCANCTSSRRISLSISTSVAWDRSLRIPSHKLFRAWAIKASPVRKLASALHTPASALARLSLPFRRLSHRGIV